MQLSHVDQALETWSRYLIGVQPTPGAFEQHLLCLDTIARTSQPLRAPNINRYLLRAIERTVIAGQRNVIVYSKLGRLLLLGFVAVPDASKDWKGTRLHLNSGRLGGDIVAPDYLWECVEHRAASAHEAFGKISPRQQARIDDAVVQNKTAAASSEIFRAMNRDVEFFGRQAFGPATEADETSR